MSRVDHLLAEYAAAFKAGQVDPWPFLDQVKGGEREDLDQKIEEFLLEVEPDRWDPVAYQNSPAFGMVKQLVSKVLIPEQGWKELLPSMRLRKQMKRESVSSELARSLGAETPDESEKVIDYYNDMEQGNLDPRGVSDRVLEALSDIYGTTVEILRRAGEATPSPRAGGTVFARRQSSPSDSAVSFELTPADSIDADSHRVFSRIKGKPDRIDRLFVDIEGSEAGR